MTTEKHNRRFNPAAYRIGIVGGGQLAKMTAQAAIQLGCEVVILERHEDTPAQALAIETLIGDWDDPKNLLSVAEKVDLVSLENEFVEAMSLAKVEKAGHLLCPGSKTIGLVQDKLIQKQTLQAAGIPMPDFRTVTSPEEVRLAANDFGWPLVLKVRRNGYDGKGNATLKDEDDIAKGWIKLGGDQGRTLYVEAFCPFTKELAIMVTRARNGELATYPVVETIQKDHICHTVIAPASVPDTVAKQATALAQKAVTAIDGIGTIGVEMFLTSENKILLNEMAPRVHNSGHYTIEGCECSQFENHVRALLGWPLGSTKMLSSVAMMVNLLGVEDSPGYPTGIEQALAIEGVHVHSYGKSHSRKGRKMGHLTVLGESLDQVKDKAAKAANHIQFGAA